DHRQRRGWQHARKATRAFGQEHPDPRAWRLAQSARKITGMRRRYLSTTATYAPTPGTIVTASHMRRRCITLLVAQPRCSAPHLTACAARILASCSITTTSPRPGRSATRSWSRTTHALSRCTTCELRGQDPTEPVRRILASRCPTNRAFQQLFDNLIAA